MAQGGKGEAKVGACPASLPFINEAFARCISHILQIKYTPSGKDTCGVYPRIPTHSDAFRLAERRQKPALAKVGTRFLWQSSTVPSDNVKGVSDSMLRIAIYARVSTSDKGRSEEHTS